MSTPQDHRYYYAPALRSRGSAQEDRPPQPPPHNRVPPQGRHPQPFVPPAMATPYPHRSSQQQQQQQQRIQRKPLPPIHGGRPPQQQQQQPISPSARHRQTRDQPTASAAAAGGGGVQWQHQQRRPPQQSTPQRGLSYQQQQHHPRARNSNNNHGPQRIPQHHDNMRRQTSLTRNRSLSRPDRYRPRPSMIRNTTPPSQQGPLVPPHASNTPMSNNEYNGVPLHRPGVPDHRPMPNRLQQQQIQQQKLRQQQEAGLGHAILRNPTTTHVRKTKQQQHQQQEEEDDQPNVLTSWWAWTAYIATCCFPAWCLRTCCRKRSILVQQAWREKIALVLGIILLCCALVYITYGLNMTLCPENRSNIAYSAVGSDGVRRPVYSKDVRVFGRVYDMDRMKEFFATQGLNLTNDFENMDIGAIFDGDTKGACSRFGENAALGSCTLHSPYGGSMTTSGGGCIPLRELDTYMKPTGSLGFDWVDLTSSYTFSTLTVLGNTVLNLTTYMHNDTAIFGDYVDTTLKAGQGKDVSYQLLYEPAGSQARDCLVARFSSGMMESDTGGCIAAQIIMNLMLIVIVAMIVVRYSMALTFQWFIAGRLVKPGGRSNWLAWRSIKGGNDDPANHIPGPYAYYNPNNYAGTSNSSSSSSLSSRRSDNMDGAATTTATPSSGMIKAELYTIMLVTCYSEGYDGLQTTMDSLARTTYSNKHKCFMVVCDGMITGAGETRTTPDIVVGMMDLDPTMREPKQSSYVAIADGERQLNMAKVYAGHYKGVPCIVVVKCGTEEEVSKPKAGNRGKRDSQLIVMQFFQRVLFNDRLSELDYEIFWKMTWLMKGVTPDKFELVLMVDADTKVLPDAITYMVAAMANDITIMGLCGETRIANKLQSWVTAIQVFEYYISHNYAKAFESLFGIVTCLPGCFSMYRIKAPKNGAWVPILANPDIILEYNQNIVTTLHAKNLLLLGEDRFLSTLMLRTFPRRQMMYVPQARCKTVVPDQFRVLLSQRRRWINSTVHNLMELVLVSDLCGIACLSMQFSVFVDLVGTLVLPAAICLTVYLIVNTAISSDPQWQSLALLVAILGLPAVLIAITTFKVVYIGWMCVYLIALPIWNFVLPIYSYWHFDDFSWGATRVVVGEKKDKGHLDAEGKFDSSRLVMKKWEDWEAERTGQSILPRNRPILLTPQVPPPPAAPTRLANPIFANRQLYSPPLVKS